jgi:hypothetical protein
LRFWWRAEAAAAQPNDHLVVYVEQGSDYDELFAKSASGQLNEWNHVEVDFPAQVRGPAILGFVAVNDQSIPTTFRIDKVELLSCGRFLDLPLILR